LSILDNMPHTCDAYRRKRTAGSLGDSRDSFESVFAGRACWRQPASAKEIEEYGKRGFEVTNKIYFLADPNIDERHTVVVGGTNVAEGFEERNNSSIQFNSMNPAVSLVTDAASLAALYEFLLDDGVTRTGKRLLSGETLRRYTTPNYVGWERNSRAFAAVGRGFMVGASFPTIYGWWRTGGCFGHPGGFSSLAFGDRDTGVAAAIVTNGNRGFMDLARRFMPLAAGLRRACR